MEDEETDDLVIELRLARLENLMERRPLLLNSVLLRQNPHNVNEWLKRVELLKEKPTEVNLWFYLTICMRTGVKSHVFVISGDRVLHRRSSNCGS